ncbi:MAG: hypothetical protein IJA15_08240, partial [Clostridia bacterium]|nr:hypothetical protein [Clostridia bacterium]
SADSTPVTPKFEMLGAGIRLEDPTGIRFGARIDGERYGEVISGEDTLFGAIIIPKDILGETEISSSNDHVKALNGKTYLDSINNYSSGLAGKVEIDKSTKEPTGYYTISYSMSNVKYGNLNREFFGLVYIRSGEAGSYTYEYATLGDVTTRTVADVAKAYYDLASDDEISIVESFIYKAEYLANDTTSENYEQSEASAENYIAAQKQAIDEFKTSIPTETNQSAINASMAKYNALGDFAKTLVKTEKAEIDVMQEYLDIVNMKNTITELSEKESYIESDYYKIYGLKASYAALSEEDKAIVDNYEELSTIEEKFLNNYDVEVVFGATEEEGGVSTNGQTNTPTLSYGMDKIYGNTIQITNVGGEQRLSAVIQKNYDNAYDGYNLYFNVITSNYAYAQYFDGGDWFTDNSVVLNSNTWTQFDYISSVIKTNYQNARHIGFNIIKDGNFKMSAVFAIKNSAVVQINAKITELSNKAKLEPSDYHAIYGIKSNYASLNSDKQAKINYATLLEIEAAFLKKYDVQVVFGATESEAGVKGGAASTNPTLSYSKDDIFGSVVKFTSKNTNKTYAVNMANADDTYSDNNIYFNILSEVTNTLTYVNKQGAWETANCPSITANEWTSYSFDSADLYRTYNGGRHIGLNSLTISKSFSISAVFAIRAKFEGDGTVVFGDKLATQGVTAESSNTWGATETISTVSNGTVISDTYTYDGSYGNVIKVDVEKGTSGNTTNWAVKINYQTILDTINATGAESVTVNIWVSKDTSILFGGYSSGYINLSGTSKTSLTAGWNAITITKADLENIIAKKVSNLCNDWASLPLTLLVSDFYLNYAQ